MLPPVNSLTSSETPRLQNADSLIEKYLHRRSNHYRNFYHDAPSVFHALYTPPVGDCPGDSDLQVGLSQIGSATAAQIPTDCPKVQLTSQNNVLHINPGNFHSPVMCPPINSAGVPYHQPIPNTLHCIDDPPTFQSRVVSQTGTLHCRCYPSHHFPEQRHMIPYSSSLYYPFAHNFSTPSPRSFDCDVGDEIRSIALSPNMDIYNDISQNSDCPGNSGHVVPHSEMSQASAYSDDCDKDTNELQCEQCHKHFARASDLRVHRRVHTGERPYTCPTCNKSFTTSSNLNRHRMIHTKKRKKYSCSMCKRQFHTESQMKRHQSMHHDGIK